MKLLIFILFFIRGLYAYVYDVDPLNPVKEYFMEKEIFDHTNGDWFRSFPDFQDWLEDREMKEKRFHEWLIEVFCEVGRELINRNYDPRESCEAESPENGMHGDILALKLLE